MAGPRLVCVLALLALSMTMMGSQALAREDNEQVYGPGTYDASALIMLGEAKYALSQLAIEDDPLTRRVLADMAIEALTGLYQLHGCHWALPPLVDVLGGPACPDLMMGYSLDGRTMLRVEPLILKNPAFEGYTVLLCTLISNTSHPTRLAGPTGLLVTMAAGSSFRAEPLTPEHQLWPQLSKLVDTFDIPDVIYSGGGVAFKQLFCVPELQLNTVSEVSLSWDGYGIVVPNYALTGGHDD